MVVMRASIAVRLATVALAVVLAPVTPAPAAITDAGGQDVANTDWSRPDAQVVGLPGSARGAAPAPCRRLAAPATREDDGPEALGGLRDAGSPEEDLAAALARLAAAGGPAAADD